MEGPYREKVGGHAHLGWQRGVGMSDPLPVAVISLKTAPGCTRRMQQVK